MAPQNAESANKPYIPETPTPPAAPSFSLPSLELFSPKPPASVNETSGGLDGARSDAYRSIGKPYAFNMPNAPDSSSEKVQFFQFGDGKTSDLSMPAAEVERALSPSRKSEPAASGISRDSEHGDRITEINFSGSNKNARIGYANDAATTPNRIDVDERAQGGLTSRTSYRQEESGKWGLYVNDRRLTQLPGDVKLAADGTISHETGDGYWHTERPDGSVLREKQLAGGARVTLGNDGAISQVSRADGSRVEAERISGHLSSITETDAKGNIAHWTSSDGSWTSSEKPGEVRKNMQIFDNGLLSYESGDSRVHVLGNGNQLRECTKSDAQNIKFDEHGRLKAITYPNGDTRSVVFDEGSDKVKSMTYTVKKSGQTFEYNRIGADDKFDYKLTDANGRVKSGKWNGSIDFSADGTFSTTDGAGNGRTPDGFSTRVPCDGKTYLEKKNADGSTLICDQSKDLKGLIRPDGSKVECQREGGQLTKVSETRPDGTKINFAYDSQTKSWSSDSSIIPISKTPPVDADGTVKFKTADGSVHTFGSDGKEKVVTRDGATLENNSKGELERIVLRNGEYRVISRDSGGINGFTDYDKSGAVKRDLKGVSGVSLGNNGDFKYVDANGATVVEKSNFSRVENDASGKISKVTRPDGSHRDFVYDSTTGELTKISDVSKTDKGERADDWMRKRNADGTWSNTYERLRPQDGRVVESRTEVALDTSGDYTYKDSKGRERESHVSERFRRSGEGFSSATIEEAHYNFLDEMRMNIKDDAKMERLELMMNGFEKRFNDAIELRVAGGESEDSAREKMETQVAATYDNLTRLVQSDSAAIDDKATRVMLAETFMYHAWEPETVNQQGWGSCWLQSGYIPCGLGKHTDDMAKVLADVSLTGSYTDRKGNTYSFQRDQLGIRNRADGAGWSIQGATNDNSQPSPVAHRLDRTLSVMDRGAGYGGAGNSGRIRTGGGGQKEILRRITGDELLYIGAYPGSQREREALLKAGGAQRSGGPGHVATLEMRKIGDNWAIVRGDQYDNRDRVISVIRDLNRWKQTGECARIDRAFAPEWNKEFKIADAVKPSDYKPGPNRPNRPRDNDDYADDRPSRPIIAFFRRRRG